jgi:serine/threonine-protein kinase
VAPEQIQAEPATAASDIYSLAAVLYECLTGEVPFPKPSEAATIHAHVMEPPPKVSERRPDLPPALDGVIAQGMAKDPWSRPSLATELIQAASRALSSSAAFIPAAAPPRGDAGETERRVQTTKVPTIAPSAGTTQPGTAAAGDLEAAARREVTRPVSRSRIEPVARRAEPSPGAALPGEAAPGKAAPDGARRRATVYQRRLVALIAGLTVVAFVAGFALGLIVH